MKFIKTTFPISVKDDERPDKGVFLRKKEGYTDESGLYGFHKLNATLWVLTDLTTGCSIYCGKTRKSCAEIIEQCAEAIDKAHQTNACIEMAKTYKENIEKENY